MSRIAGRCLVPIVAGMALSCGGGSNPPPPAASPSGWSARNGPLPLGSHEGAGADVKGSADALPPGHPPIGEVPPSSAATAPAGSVSGTITVAGTLRGRLAASDVLYVMAKKDGSTLAVRRIEGPRFPVSFEISGAEVMVAGTGFGGPVDVVARLSKTGDAIASAGDLEGSASGVQVPAEGVAVTIDRVRQ